MRDLFIKCHECSNCQFDDDCTQNEGTLGCKNNYERARFTSCDIATAVIVLLVVLIAIAITVFTVAGFI
jgi:hypothetical protein